SPRLDWTCNLGSNSLNRSIAFRKQEMERTIGGLWYPWRFGFFVVVFLGKFRLASLSESRRSFVVVFALAQVGVEFPVDLEAFFPALNFVQQFVLDVLHGMSGNEAAVAVDGRAELDESFNVF